MQSRRNIQQDKGETPKAEQLLRDTNNPRQLPPRMAPPGHPPPSIPSPFLPPSRPQATPRRYKVLHVHPSIAGESDSAAVVYSASVSLLLQNDARTTTIIQFVHKDSSSHLGSVSQASGNHGPPSYTRFRSWSFISPLSYCCVVVIPLVCCVFRHCGCCLVTMAAAALLVSL